MEQDQLLKPRSDVLLGGSLLENRRFVALCTERFLSSTAQHAIYYALLIVVVERTGSSIHSGLLIFSFLLPGVLAGLYTGVVADRWPKQLIMFLSQGLRAGACVAFFLWSDSIWLLYAITLGFALVAQFNSPAESAAVPHLVPHDRLAAANALLNLTSLIAQGMGMLVLATLFMKVADEKPLFIVTAVIFAGAAIAATAVGHLGAEAPSRPRIPMGRGGLVEEFKRVWRTIASDNAVYNAVVQLTLATTAILVLVALIPHYVDEVLDTGVDNVAFVFAPAGLGLLAGLRLAPWLGQRMTNARVVTVGFILFVITLASLGFVQNLSDLFEQTLGPLADAYEWTGLSLQSTVAMGLAIPVGFAFSLVNVAGRAVLHERAPADMRGRIFAVQMVLGSLASIVPLFIVGGLAEVLPARVLISLVAVTVLLAAIYSRLRGAPRTETLPRTV
jgi:MFS family permease